MRPTLKSLFLIVGVIIFGFGLVRAQPPDDVTPTVTVIANGLLNPVGLALLPDGSLLIAEEGTGDPDLSAGVSLMTPEGDVGRLISGLPSGRDSGDLSGVPLVAVAPDYSQIYVGNFGAGHLWTLPLSEEGTLALPETPFTPEQLGQAMAPFNNVRLTNPFDMTFDADGLPVVSDASENGVAKPNADGTTRFIHRFDELVNPLDSRFTIDAVPTGIARVGDEYYVTLFGGCPYPPAGGELVAIDEQRNQRTVIDSLNMPIDVAVGPDGTVWVLEFATFNPDGSCFSGMGYRHDTGRLSYITEEGRLQPVLTGLNFPGAVLPLPDGSLFMTEIFDGEVLHITFDEPVTSPITSPEPVTISYDEPVYLEADDYDAALAAVIREQGLQPNPGEEWREGDTALARLGRDLFFDPVLSGDLNISCATCHHPAFGMADGRVLPIGTSGDGLGPAREFMKRITPAHEAYIHARVRAMRADIADDGSIENPFNGQFVPRNAPTIINSALLPVQFWDGRVESYALGLSVRTRERRVNELFELTDVLTAQALFPLTSLHEMAGVTFGGLAPQTVRDALAERLMTYPAYAEMFTEVFGTETITPLQIAQALAAFERQLIFTDAPWDAYLGGDQDALTDAQKRGALLFYGALNPDVNCASCHLGDLQTDLRFHNLLVPQLGPGKGHGEDGRDDWGRGGTTFDRRHQYQFRTPSLRNVTLTAPYFHNGAYTSLEAVIWHHADIFGSAANYDPAAHLPADFYSSVQPFDAEEMAYTAAPQLEDGLPLTERDVADLVAFMHSLTDPAAADLDHLLPEAVPSGLPLDPVPSEIPQLVSASVDRPQRVVSSEVQETEDGAWRFIDVTDDTGLAFQHGAFVKAISDDPAAGMGAGLCWIDYDNDGWLDLYLVNSHAEEEISYLQANGGLPRNALYRNVGGQFVDVSASSGTDLALRGNGCVAADFNRDGWMDLFVTADGPNALLWNQGDGTFVEGAAAAGVDAPEWNAAAAVADLNEDGWPDLYVGAYIDLNNKVPRPVGAFPQDYYGLPDRLYISEGASDGGRVTFREVTQEVGLTRAERGLGAIFSDLDNDGDLDLYVANDGQANRLYMNVPVPGGITADPLGIGFRLVDQHETAEVGDTGSGMGVAGGDWNNDGQFDLLVTNWDRELNAIYLNQTAEAGYLNFQYSTYRIGMMGLGNNMTGWGTALADFDHDGDKDMLTVNGRVPVANFETDAELIRLYGNRSIEGYPGQFREWTKRVGFEEIGTLMARGSALADFDQDGDLDIAINTIGGRALLLMNVGATGNWLRVQLADFAPGTVVTVTLPDGTELHREWHVGSSYLASEDPALHFGVGDADELPQVVVTWPDGQTQTLTAVASNQLLTIARPTQP